MAIKIDKIINLTQDSLNTSPKLVKNLQIAMEPDASIFQYYIENNRAGDKESDIVLGSYDNVKWQLPATHLTTQKVKNIGIKSFPQVGAIGFFTFLNEERSKILAPIHVKSKKYTAPSINVIENDTTLTIVISPPIDYGVDESDEVNDIFSDGHENFDDGDGGTVNEKIKYICHRVILRLDQFALEYVTYENTLEVDKPATTGTYDIYCVGYIHEGEAVSEDSNHVYLDITGTRDTWPGPVEGSDLFITDVEVTDENKVHIRRSDGFQKDSDNLIPVPVGMTFLEDGRLQMTLNNGTTVTSNNVSPGGGGGGSASLYLHAIDKLLPTNNTLRVSSDTLLAKEIDKDKFMTSTNVSDIQRIDDLTVRVNLSQAASAGEQIKVKANRNAYLNNNGGSEELLIEVPELTYQNLLGDYSLMTQIRTNSKADSGSDSITTTLSFPDVDTRNLVSSFTLSGDSYATIGSSSRANVNQRDASIYNSWKQEGTCEGVDFIKLRWNGMSYYGDSVADSTWELYLFTNGDAMIHIVDYPKNTGTCSFLGRSFTISKDNPTVSFYRQDYYGEKYTIVSECYGVSKHNSNADVPPSNTIQGQVGMYHGNLTKIRNNSKNDDGTDAVNFVDFTWNNLTSLIVSGNSWMGSSSSSEDIKFNRRDAASYYIYYQDMQVEDYGGLHAIRIVWGGSSAYSGSINQWWELWLFENGDAMIYCKKLGSSSGTSSFYGISYTPSNGSYHSFYKNGDSWTKEDDIYDLSKHIS